VRVIDSHTEGEPTRVIVEGGPDLGGGSMAERRARFARDFDHCRRFAVSEPRGHSAIVGALLLAPVEKTSAAGLIFFNNGGYLGMCGHGAIGAAVTLAHMGRIGPGRHNFETPVGVVRVELHDRNKATVENIASHRRFANLSLKVEALGEVRGDVAWGGNWFFLTEDAPCALTPSNIPALTRGAEAIKAALAAEGVTGADGAEINHIEFFGPPSTKDADSCNFVLCSGGAYDRSPCGTGTSAKLACLAEDGKLAPGAEWIQEGIVGADSPRATSATARGA
jgi:4-hydroxyproline epimerase